ncbi:MAG TPA: hypothetical protein VGR44_11295 [Methylomirabilota bacterium]|jgi:hypothetical protein|nr:hypothetical protein [Methylomirabilota bacterium]
MTTPADPSTWKLPRLRIDREGAWFHEDEEITHPGILGNLWGSLRVDAEGHFIRIGPARVPVEVEDAPFVAVRVEPAGDGLALTLNDMSREPLAPESLAFKSGGIPYCRVKGGRFICRLSRAATYQLLQHVEQDEAGGGATLVLGGARYPLSGLSEPPTAR